MSPEVEPRFKEPKVEADKPRFATLKRSRLKRGGGLRQARPDDRLSVWCEAGTPDCAGRVVVRHHKRGRGKPGDDDRAHTLDCCHPCHLYIHAHPAEAYDAGWLERRT